MSSNLPANPNNNNNHFPAAIASADLLMQQYNIVNTALKDLKIVDAKFDDGSRYYHDPKTDNTMLIGIGASVVETPTAYHVTMTKPDVRPNEAMFELGAPLTFTQEQKGAYVGRSQAWASGKLSNNK